MFIKTFHDVVINEFDQSDLSVVLLRRRLDKVLKSFLELGYFTQDNNDWVHWMHLPHGVNLVAQPPGSIENFDDVDRAIGYLFDIEARMQRFPVEYPGINVVEAAIEEISTNEGAERLLGQLGLKSTLHTQIVAGHRTNSRTTLKLREVDIDECRSRIVAYHGRAEEGRGICSRYLPAVARLILDICCVGPTRRGSCWGLLSLMSFIRVRLFTQESLRQRGYIARSPGWISSLTGTVDYKISSSWRFADMTDRLNSPEWPLG